MARIVDPTPEQVAGYIAWVHSRPPHVQAVAARFDPWSLYRMKSTGQRVTVASFGVQEDGTVTLTVNVTGEFNLVMFDRGVFGIAPDDLEPCELPSADEVVGAQLSPAQVDENIDALRLAARPDLWTEDPHTGKAIRKS